MTSEEKAEKIKNIYDEAMKKLEALSSERKELVTKYIRELEAQKIAAIRESMGLPSKQ